MIERASAAGRSAVIVTGGAGYIGSHVILALDAAGYAVSVIDDLSTGFRCAVPAHMAFHQGDIGDAALIDRILAAGQFDAIIHFAGSVVVPESVSDPLKYYHNNTANSRGLIAAAVRHGIGNFVFSSTAAVYGQPDKMPVSEDEATVPITPYGSSKLMIEWMLRDVAAAHDLRYTALRYFNVAGADPGGRTGQSTVGATHLIKIATETIAGRRDGVSIFGTDYPTPDGTAVRDYIHVSDLADAHVLALARMLGGGCSLTLNCGYGHGYSVREVLDAARRVCGQPITFHDAPRRAGDSPILIADISRARSELGWQPARDDLEMIIADALRWELKTA